MDKHAVYAICRMKDGTVVPFRVGMPTDWNTAQDRFERLYPTFNRPARVVKWMRRRYRVEWFEVRAVDRHGRGIGSIRHGLAFPVPYRACVKA